jgi:hypothetical protein
MCYPSVICLFHFLIYVPIFRPSVAAKCAHNINTNTPTAHQYGGSGAMHSLTTSASSKAASQMTQSISSTSPLPATPTTTRSLDHPVQSSPWDLLTGWGRSPVPQETEREFALSGGAKNALVAVQRYYSNISTDFERQQSIDLLLGARELIPSCLMRSE